MSPPNRTRPSEAEAGSKIMAVAADSNGITTVPPIPFASLPFDQTATEVVGIKEIDRRRRAFFELQAFLRDVA